MSEKRIRLPRAHLVWVLALLLSAPLKADRVVLGTFEREWNYLPGLAEASAPDAAAWRQAEFDLSTWATGFAPFGFGRRPPYATDLALLDPPMEDNYSTLYLRGTFEVPDAARTEQLFANLLIDDAAVLWINGTEVYRTDNVDGSAGDPVPFNSVATRAFGPRVREDIDLGDPAGYLLQGTNVVAVQVINRSLSNNDLMFDLELFDPDGPDVQPPQLEEVLPLRDTTVRRLTQIEVVFDEPVTGLEASDLLVAGQPATGVTGADAGPYTFSFAEPAPGEISVEWVADHGIVDTAPDINGFEGGSWAYSLDPSAPPPPLVLNEVLLANRTGLQILGKKHAWVEIANLGNEPVSLAGMTLTNDPNDTARWVFPNIVVAPEGFLVVLLSGSDRRESGDDLHTNFQLSVGGDYVGLFGSDLPREALSEFAPEYPPQAPDISFGRDSSGGLSYLDPPTPDAPNDTSTALEARVSQPVLSEEHGFFETPFMLEILASTPDSEIRYSTDGSEPTQEGSRLYEGPLTIDATTPLRARAFRSGWVPSAISTRTYIFIEDVLKQPTLLDRIVNDPDTSSVIKDSFRSIPTFSIAIEPDEMFGSGGAYSNKGDHATSIELIPEDGTGGFQADCSIERHSNSSPKSSLRLLFKREYGSPKLRYPLFESSPVHSLGAVDFFDRIILRAGKNQSWTSGRFLDLVTYVEDQWVRDSQITMSGIGSHGTFVHLYINGVYWGLYNSVERPDHWFTSAYLGGSERDHFATNFNNSPHLSGDPARYNEMIARAVARDLEDSQKYAEFTEFVDIDEFIDYVILFWFSGVGDGVENNWYGGMRLNPPGKFQLYMWDGEFIFLSTAGPPGNDTAWVPPYFFDGSLATTPMVRIWQAAFENPEFQLRFADRVYKHCFHDGALAAGPARERLKKLTDFVEDAIIGESARWGGGRTRDGTWRSAVRRLDAKLINNVDIFIGALRTFRPASFPGAVLYPEIDPPLLSHPGGSVKPGLAVSALSGNGRILYTLDGSDPRLPGGAVSPTALEVPPEPNSPFTFPLDSGADARILVPQDGSLGDTWIATDFDDSSWTTGKTGIGFGTTEGFEPEIQTNLEAAMLDQQASAYVRIEFNLENPNPDFVWLDVKYDDGFVAFLNGEPLASGNSPDELTWDATASRAHTNSRALQFEAFDLADHRELLQTGRNVLAIQLLNRRANDRDLLLVPRLRTAEFGESSIVIDQTTTLKTRVLTEGGVWSALRETPFAVTEGSTASLAITEISYNPDESGAEFIELHNPTPAAVLLEGVEFSNGIEFRFGPGQTIEAGGYLVLARDASVFAQAYPDVELAGTYVGRLANDGEKVTLKDAEGITIVSAEYNDGDFWPLGPDGFGYTLVPWDSTDDLDDPRAWRASAAPKGSPGAEDPLPLHDGIVISEVLPDDGTGDAAVELWNWTDTTIDVGGWFLSPDRTNFVTLTAAYAIPSGTSIDPDARLVVQESDLGFDLDALGGSVYLTAAEANAVPSGYIVGVDHGAIEKGVSFGMYETSTGLLEFTAMAAVTLGAANSEPRAPQVAINEIHYHPAEGGVEFLELFNPGASAVQVGGWVVRGISDAFGEDSFTLPPDTLIPPAGFLVLVPVTPAEFPDAAEGALVIGPYGGALNNAGETVRLRKPANGGGVTILVDEVSFNDSAPWPVEPDGDGSSLERIVASGYGNDAAEWAASQAAGGTPGATNSVSEVIEPPAGGLQRPGDLTQDANLDILDGIVLLDHLFGATTQPLPCEGETAASGGNLALLDGDGSGVVDLSDALYLMNFLFQRGPAPVLGASCTPIEGCPAACQ